MPANIGERVNGDLMKKAGTPDLLRMQDEKRAEDHEITDAGERRDDAEPPRFGENTPRSDRMQARGGGATDDDGHVQFHLAPWGRRTEPHLIWMAAPTIDASIVYARNASAPRLLQGPRPTAADN